MILAILMADLVVCGHRSSVRQRDFFRPWMVVYYAHWGGIIQSSGVPCVEYAFTVLSTLRFLNEPATTSPTTFVTSFLLGLKFLMKIFLTREFFGW